MPPTATFHCFRRLPPEIQLYLWKTSICEIVRAIAIPPDSGRNLPFVPSQSDVMIDVGNANNTQSLRPTRKSLKPLVEALLVYLQICKASRKAAQRHLLLFRAIGYAFVPHVTRKIVVPVYGWIWTAPQLDTYILGDATVNEIREIDPRVEIDPTANFNLRCYKQKPLHDLWWNATQIILPAGLFQPPKRHQLKIIANMPKIRKVGINIHHHCKANDLVLGVLGKSRAIVADRQKAK
ncbi:hypothetical protein SUNI508_02645 [Seiridium unicorne]|uniref:2EXR domain-containing protein n=1 Tax=Seiridium unicorne TaxID=138068 RepID=A0ABR2UFX4_9PEZI